MATFHRSSIDIARGLVNWALDGISSGTHCEAVTSEMKVLDKCEVQ